MTKITTRDQKIFLNIMLIAAFLFICVLLLIGIFMVWTENPLSVATMSVRIGISIILIWFMIFLPYLAWAVYFYNINLGMTNEEWESLKRKNEEMANGEKKIEPANPYKDETFGLPPGTIRGSLAITLMVGALAMFVVAIGHPTVLHNNEFFHENFEFFKTAFLMMIAFYFGSKSLEYLQKRWTIDTGSPGSQASPSTSAPTGEAESETETESPTSTGLDAAIGQVRNQFTDTSEQEAEPTETASTEKEQAQPSHLLSVMSAVNLIPQVENKETQKTLSEDDIREHAQTLNVEVAALKAVIEVESAGKGFLPDGRPKILFEGHIFWDQLKKAGLDPTRYATDHPQIVYPRWTKQFYKGGAAEYERLNAAKLIHEEAALKSASWGMFQIMGFNHALCGFDSVKAFVDKLSENERAQMEAFTKFCEKRNLIGYLHDHNWAAFAKAYNGPAYAQNQYDYKLEMKYHAFSRQFNDTLSVKVTREQKSDKQTTGTLVVMDKDHEVFRCRTLELPWKNNQRNISCIPVTGATPYTVVKRFTEERGNHFHVLNVPQRSSILIHSGNYYTHTLGCILVGKDLTDLNKDGYADVTNSKLTLAKLVEILPDSFPLTIS
jgi:hypothetical protein